MPNKILLSKRIIHALINYENYDMRIDGSKIKVIEGT